MPTPRLQASAGEGAEEAGSSEGQLGRTSRIPGTMPVTLTCRHLVHSHDNLINEASVVVLQVKKETQNF